MYGIKTLTLKERIEKAGMMDLYRTRGINRITRRAEMLSVLHKEVSVPSNETVEKVYVKADKAAADRVFNRKEKKKVGLFRRIMNYLKKK